VYLIFTLFYGSACLSVPEWEMAVKNLYEEAKRTMNDSTLLRSIVDDAVLKKSAKRLRDQADAVDIALARFISDTQHVEQALGNDLKQVIKYISFKYSMFTMIKDNLDVYIQCSSWEKLT
jgi:hypothetical protein